MSDVPIESLPAAERRRLVAIGLLRALATTVMVVAAYYLLPLDKPWLTSHWVWPWRPGPLALTAVVAYQVRSHHPASALSRTRDRGNRLVTVPVFLILFAATYFMMEQSNPGNFNVDNLALTDSLYFTVTVFATVGFEDITATTQAARVVVIAQMLLDLLVLGLVVKVFVGAVEIGRGRRATGQNSES